MAWIVRKARLTRCAALLLGAPLDSTLPFRLSQSRLRARLLRSSPHSHRSLVVAQPARLCLLLLPSAAAAMLTAAAARVAAQLRPATCVRSLRALATATAASIRVGSKLACGARCLSAAAPSSRTAASAAMAATVVRQLHSHVTRAPARLFSSHSTRVTALNDAVPPTPAADSADLPFTLPAPESLPTGSFVLGYLAQSGHLSAMLDEIEAQENAARGLRAEVIGLHGNLAMVRFDRIDEGAAFSAAAAAAPDASTASAASSPAIAADPIPPSMLHPLHAATVWFSPAIASFRSISHASEILRTALRASNPVGGIKGVKFSSYSFEELALARRSSLILESLPRSKIFSDPEARHTFPLQLLTLLPKQGAEAISGKRVMQMDENGVMQLLSSQPSSSSASSQPLPPLAAFTLLSSSCMLYSPRTSSPLPNGALSFRWDRTGPPSRAYLKLWEALSRTQIAMMQDPRGMQAGAARWEQIKPQKHTLALDLGAAPGGWTWALAQMGCTVVSVDRSELSLAVARLPNVHHHLGSGFSVEPDAEILRPFLEKREKQRRKAASKARAKQERASLQQFSALAEESDAAEEEDEYAEQAAQMRDVEAAQEFSPVSAESNPSLIPVASAPSPRRVDWLFSDIVCYPDRSLALIERWLKADAVECGIVVTIKMQSDPAATAEPTPPGFVGSGEKAEGPSKGAVQRHHLAAWPEVLARLRAIPHSTLTHLQENKNELTFVWIRPSMEDEAKHSTSSSEQEQPEREE